MRYIKLMIVCALALFLTNTAFSAPAAKTNSPIAVAVSALDNPDAWVLTLNGSGTSVIGENSKNGLGLDVGIGRTGKLLLPLEAGVRQGILYSTSEGIIGSTKVYSDWTLFTVKKVDLFAGANMGATYGHTPLTWTIAPEAGLRYWLKKDIAIVGRVEYPITLNNPIKDDNRFNYLLGFQIKF